MNKGFIGKKLGMTQIFLKTARTSPGNGCSGRSLRRSSEENRCH